MIKKLHLTVTMMALSIAVPLSALASSYTPASYTPTSATDDGWYASVLAGAGYTPNVHTSDPFEIASYRKPSWQVGGAIGYRSGPMRYEGEFLYQHAAIRSINDLNGGTLVLKDFDLHGITQVSAGLANIYYDFNQISSASFPFNPYLGLGVGYANVYNRIDTSFFNNDFAHTHNSGTFAYQGIAGLNYNFDRSISMQLDYRYFGTTHVNVLGARWQNHTLNLGMTILFNAMS